MDVGDQNVALNRVKDDVADRCQKLFQDFLEEFKSDENGEIKYADEARKLVKPERNTLLVSFLDVEKFNQGLSTTIQEEYYRVYPALCQAVRNFVSDRTDNLEPKEFFVGFKDLPTRHKIRELKTAKVGTLMRITGQVVRAHPVHPELVVATFKCIDCQTLIKDIEQQFKYTEPTICSNPVCSNRRRFGLEIPRSKFVDFQKVRIQETQAELPRGSIPRTVDIIIRAEAVESAQPGDRCDFTGTLVVVPDVRQLATKGVRTETPARQRMGEAADAGGIKGLKELGVRELSYRMAFLAHSVCATNPRFGGKEISPEDMTVENLRNQMSTVEWEKIYAMSQDKELYQNLITSLFPTIHGNDDIKRGILLMLFGGVHKTTGEGTSLRGDINVCIVGDPSTGKSQFLKRVSEFYPRAVYTSGKASSAAGLTAAVVRDEETNEFVIEAGALMLADNGVCCIDEFDKMDLRDQVAIHEAMEQQTISIAKAGIKATLSAKTSILAAANPIGGRYDKARSLKQNINMSDPIMSRFDLFFILVDQFNEVTDYAIARRIVDLHNFKVELIERKYSDEDILRYLIFARQFKPKLTKDAQIFLVDKYKELRQRDTAGLSKSCWRITVRQLESMIRLSEALAKMYCSDEVQPKHVREAHRLINKSIITVEQPDIDLNEDEDEERPMDVSQDEDKEEFPPSLNSQPKERQKISYEEYKALSNLLIIQLKKTENRADDEEEGEGMKKSELINWYISEIEEDIDSVEELTKKKALVEKVLDRLIEHDRVIVALSSIEEAEKKDDDPLLVVHPNYVTEAYL